MTRRVLSLAAVAGFALLFVAMIASAQPVTSGGGLSRVQVTGGGLAGSGTTANPLKVRSDCADGQVLKSTTGAWGCAADSAVSDGDKGDVTVSASGATWTIDNDVVTYAKMQNVSATDKLLGRSTVGAGDVEEIACTAAGRALIDDADAAAQRATLGLGVFATLADGDHGDITTTLSGATWDIDAATVGTPEIADNLDLSANGSTTVGDFRYTVIAPAISATENNWAPTGIATATHIHAATSGTPIINGLTGGAAGRIITIYNDGGSPLVITHNSGAATAANRIILTTANANVTLAGNKGCAITLVYIGAASFWYETGLVCSVMQDLIGVTTQTLTTTGNVTLGDTTADDHIANGQLVINGPGTGYALDVRDDVTGQTANGSSGRVVEAGTYDATAAIRSSLALTVVNAATRSAGANNLTNYGLYADVTGGQVNYGIFVENGDVVNNGNTTLGNADADYVNARGTLAFSGTDPTINSCGTGASVSGESQNFQVTVGTTATSCVINFGRTFNSAPFCVAAAANASASLDTTPLEIASTTTTVTLTYDTAHGQIYNVFCPDRR